MHTSRPPASHPESGNMLFIILIAVVLIGLLTAVISRGSDQNSNIDSETLIIKASEVQRYASELERAVLFILNNGHSESDIRFSHPDAHADYGDLSADADKTDQVFHKTGGGVTYRTPPSGVNDGSAWEFYGGTHLPAVGSNEADLVAVLPNVTTELCDKINALNNQTGSALDTGGSAAAGNNPGSCIHIGALGRIDNGRNFYSSANANTVDETTFAQDTSVGAAYAAAQACVICDSGDRHFYHVLLAR